MIIRKLVIICVEGRDPECKGTVELPLPITGESLHEGLSKEGWYESVLTAPGQGQGVPILIGALCGPCAPHVHSPELLASADKVMGRKK